VTHDQLWVSNNKDKIFNWLFKTSIKLLKSEQPCKNFNHQQQLGTDTAPNITN